jgi:methyltransferase (TIGR00027 family)
MIENISDTALMTAYYRALETERKDALFSDPYARRLAGEKGRRIFESLPKSQKHGWSFTTRTLLYDHFVMKMLQDGVDTVVNLAAGLDTRPYRMDLPPQLRWIEIDLPDLLEYKKNILTDARPQCRLESHNVDLSDPDARRSLFASINESSGRVLLIEEGLLIYLDPEEVKSLTRDLASFNNFRYWILSVVSPGLLKMIQGQLGEKTAEAGAPMKFAPEEGPGFFHPHGWETLEVEGMLKNAAKLGRLNLFMRLLALMPESKGKQGSSPWSGVCLMGRSDEK